jgi:hypothetical protein
VVAKSNLSQSDGCIRRAWVPIGGSPIGSRPARLTLRLYQSEIAAGGPEPGPRCRARRRNVSDLRYCLPALRAFLPVDDRGLSVGFLRLFGAPYPSETVELSFIAFILDFFPGQQADAISGAIGRRSQVAKGPARGRT